MKRYYISPIEGDGTRENPYRPKLARHGVTYVSVMPFGPDGRPTKPWCLCHVEASNHQPLLRDTEIEALPDASLDVKWQAVGTGVRSAVENRLAARGLIVVSDGQSGFREVLRQIGRSLSDTFDENNFSA